MRTTAAHVWEVLRREGGPYGRAERWIVRVMLAWRYGMPAEARLLIHLDDVGFGHEDAHGYLPSPWGILGRIIKPNQISVDDVFLDAGCGMGHALLEAALRYPFKRVIGVDLVPGFTEVAQEVLSRNRGHLRCQDFAVVTADIRDYEIPDEVTVVYLANPFVGGAFDTFVTKLIASVDRSPRRLRLIYMRPEEASRLESTGRFRLVRYGRRMLRRWAHAEYLVLYELTPAASVVS